MATSYSNEIDSQILIDQDPGSGSEIRDPDPVFLKTGIRIRIRSETDRIRNTEKIDVFGLQQSYYIDLL